MSKHTLILVLLFGASLISACKGVPSEPTPTPATERLEDLPFTDSHFRFCVISQGVELVKNLHRLDCSGFPEFDNIEGIENLYALETFINTDEGFRGRHLNLSGLDQLATIIVRADHLSTLTTSGNPNLKVIRTINNFNIKGFNFRRNTKLETIEIQNARVFLPKSNTIRELIIDTPVDNLSLSSLPNLEKLSLTNCGDYKVEGFNTTPNLKSVHSLQCSSLEAAFLNSHDAPLIDTKKLIEFSLASDREAKLNIDLFPNLHSLKLHGKLLGAGAMLPHPEKIKHLDLADGDFSHFDLAQFEQLETYNGYQENISDFDFRNSPNLRTVNIAYSESHSLLFADNPKLKSLYVYNTGETNIDLSDSPDITDVVINWARSDSFALTLARSSSLETLTVRGNSATVYNLDTASKLTTAEIWGHSNESHLSLPVSDQLTTFTCKSCGLASVDPRGATNLTTLELSGGALSGLNLSANPLLEVLNLRDNNLSNLNIDANEHLRVIDLSDNRTLNCETLEHIDTKKHVESFDRDSDYLLNCGIFPGFSDKEFAQCVHETETSPEMLTELRCGNSFESIEDLPLMPNLENLSLRCTSNAQIDKFDFRALNQLKKLSLGYCDASVGMEFASKKDIEKLILNRSNFEHIDLTDFDSLKELTVNQASLKRITLPNPSVLTHLIIRNNTELESVDLRGSKQLIELDLEVPENTEIIVNEGQHLPDSASFSGSLVIQPN